MKAGEWKWFVFMRHGPTPPPKYLELVMRSLVHVGPALPSLLFLPLVFVWVWFLGMSYASSYLIGDLLLRDFPGQGYPVLCPL